MSYDQDLVDRISLLLEDIPHVQKKMFGGVAFMVRDHMTVGVTNKSQFMVRISKDNYEEFLDEAHVAPMDFTGRVMKGFLMIEAEGIRTKSQLDKWLTRSLDYVETLPDKPKKQSKKKAKRK